MSKFVQGKFNLTNPDKYIGNRTPLARSSWEFTFMRMLDEHPSVEYWASESVRIPYRCPLSGKYTTYVPDFLITYCDKNGKKHAELVEVKPACQTFKEATGKSQYNQQQYIKNMAKWEAAQAYCKQNGIVFRVVNEDQIYHTGKKRK